MGNPKQTNAQAQAKLSSNADLSWVFDLLVCIQQYWWRHVTVRKAL